MIEPEVAELLESPCALIVGTVDASGMPDATRGWGLRVEPDGAHVRLLLSSNAAVTLANLGTTARLALTATDVATLYSVQIKGRASNVEAPTGEDIDRFERFCVEVVHRIAEVTGENTEIIVRLKPPGVIACTVRVDEVFDQTPGPSAGACLAPVESP